MDAKADNGFTPLMFACMKGHLETARELLCKGADVEAVMKGGVTALMGASLSGRLRVARMLLEQGANKSVTASNGATAFSVAKGPQKKELQALLKP